MISAIRAAVTGALLDALALILPVRCSGCGAPDRAVCGDCRHAFEGVPVRRVVGTSLTVLSAADYEGVAAAVVSAFKDGGRLDAAPVLGAALRRTLGRAVVDGGTIARGPLLLVPIPSSASSMRKRGFSPLERIARAGELPLASVLSIRRRMADQRLLGAAERAANLADAFAVRSDLTGARCVLFDDVVTTGSTLLEAHRALTAAGATVAFAVTVAATPSSRPNRGSATNPG